MQPLLEVFWRVLDWLDGPSKKIHMFYCLCHRLQKVGARCSVHYWFLCAAESSRTRLHAHPPHWVHVLYARVGKASWGAALAIFAPQLGLETL